MTIVFLSATSAVIKKNPREQRQRSVKYTGSGKFCDFQLKSLFISEMVEIGAWLLWITNRKSSVADRSVSVPTTVKGGTREVKFF